MNQGFVSENKHKLRSENVEVKCYTEDYFNTYDAASNEN